MASNKVQLQRDLALIIGKLDKLDKTARDGVATGIYLEAVSIMRVSLRQVPVDRGILRSSAYVSLPSKVGAISLKMGYGTDYGIYVHERTNATHNPPTKAHFLTDPIREALKGFTERVAKRAKKARETGNYALVGIMPTTSKYPSTGVSVKLKTKIPKKPTGVRR